MTISLRANTFVLAVEPLPPDDPTVHAGCLIATMSLTSTLPGVAVEVRRRVDILFQSLERLCNHIDEHLELLEQLEAQRSGDKWPLVATFEDRPWVDLDLNMQIALLTGYVERVDGDLTGYISIRVMLHVGHRIDGQGMYAGFEGTIDVAELISFAASLGAFMAERKTDR